MYRNTLDHEPKPKNKNGFRCKKRKRLEMSISKEKKQEVIKEYATAEGDTGSPEVQIAILTHRIKALTEHFKTHYHDHISRRGLMILIGRRKSLLKYLRGKSEERYKTLIKRLEIRK